MKLSDTALGLLSTTAQQEDRLVRRRPNAPPVVDLNVCRALVKQGLLEVVHAPADAAGLVCGREADKPSAFIISDAGFRTINLEPPRAAEPSPANPTLRQAAAAVIDSWTGIKDRRGYVALALKAVDAAYIRSHWRTAVSRNTPPPREDSETLRLRQAEHSILEIAAIRSLGTTTTFIALGRALTARKIPTPNGSLVWAHTTVARLLVRLEC